MHFSGGGRRGASTTEYIVILAVILGLILMIFGRSFIDLLRGQIDQISSGVDPSSQQAKKKKKSGTPGEPKIGGGDDGSSGGPVSVPVDSSGPVRTH